MFFSLLFGFMLPTFFLSMWVNNTAATAMMIPMVEAVLLELDFIAKPEPELQVKEAECVILNVWGIKHTFMNEKKTYISLCSTCWKLYLSTLPPTLG